MSYFNRIKHLVFKNAKLDCVEYVAPYFPQACSEGRVDDFLAAAEALYKDRWPNDPEFDSGMYRTSLIFVSVAATGLAVPEMHWEVAMSLEYDRAHRPSLKEFSRVHDLDEFTWPYPENVPEDNAQESGTEPRESDEDILKRDAADAEKESGLASGGEDDSSDDGGSVHIDFLAPFDIDEIFGEDADLFRLDKEPLVIPIPSTPTP